MEYVNKTNKHSGMFAFIIELFSIVCTEIYSTRNRIDYEWPRCEQTGRFIHRQYPPMKDGPEVNMIQIGILNNLFENMIKVDSIH